MNKLIFKLIKMLAGFFLCAISANMAINSNLGLSPWDTLHQGLSNYLGLTIGQSSILVSFSLILFTRFFGFKIGAGTLANMIVVGLLIDMISSLQLIPKSSGIIASLLLILISLAINSVGCYLYISCEMGCGPRDGFMVVMGNILYLPIKKVRLFIELAASLAGYLLGGPIGIGTIIIAILMGKFMQSIFSLFKFNVNQVKHKSLFDSLKTIKKFIYQNF
ncbi:TPA: YitT family protein [Enterococcus faecalis]|uniref:YczE/YyaS/YitT family protein n=2 Tax=Enterococcus faecalis TaxID=1351 RepID=UPI001C1B2268|nr:hypothetical protein [Enterococcus faecalis]MDK7898399.1 hypothetical protein [Enterococcus faecalis]HAP5878359.1 hypothetical protein [Enterococcus faecalis]HBE2154482.1 hypothetical protein [Enterococcus faecalis]HCY9046793.1 hypothetical protein [Enterococcus faecalis]